MTTTTKNGRGWAWIARLTCVLPGWWRAYQQICPDILAVQESSHLMERLIMQSLFEYATPQGERISYKLVTGGDTPIYYRDDKFFPIETGYYLYPEAVPGYEGSFNNARTKSYTFGVFEELSTGKRVIVVTTHLWWKRPTGTVQLPAAFQYRARISDLPGHSKGGRADRQICLPRLYYGRF